MIKRLIEVTQSLSKEGQKAPDVQPPVPAIIAPVSGKDDRSIKDRPVLEWRKTDMDSLPGNTVKATVVLEHIGVINISLTGHPDTFIKQIVTQVPELLRRRRRIEASDVVIDMLSQNRSARNELARLVLAHADHTPTTCNESH